MPMAGCSGAVRMVKPMMSMIMMIMIMVMVVTMVVMAIIRAVTMLLIMVVNALMRSPALRVLAEHQRLDGDRHRIGRHADAPEVDVVEVAQHNAVDRSEEHTSELQ